MTTQKRTTVSLSGRILYLTEDAQQLQGQLYQGQTLPFDPSRKLIDNISTDELTPGWVCYYYDETLARYPRLRATRLYDMIGPRGYEGSVRTLRKHVALVRPTPRSEVFLRTEPMIGEQSQIGRAHV